MKFGFFVYDRKGIKLVIERILNNNVVSSRDEEGMEIVVMGTGVGFGRKKGDRIDEKRVEKIFRLEDEAARKRFKDLLAKLPLEYIRLSNDVISYAKKQMGVELNHNIYLTLTDHISFALERFREGMLFQNALFHEIKRFYPKEFSIGVHALELIREQTQITLPEDEAASIALHIVNAEYNLQVRDTFYMTNLIGRMVEVLTQYVPVMGQESLVRDIVVSELKFLAYRLLTFEPLKENGDPKLSAFIRQEAPEAWEATEALKQMIREKYHCEMSQEEQLYLAIQVKRMHDIFG